MPAQEVTFNHLAGVPVHYDRLAHPFGYGSKGQLRTFGCREKLKTALTDAFEELFLVWGRGKPTIILTAGTIGDGANAHGQGFAFDLDGFHWNDARFMMNEYPEDRPFYIGINAHLFTYFPQVLSYHYPNHKDHFHVDFNFGFGFRKSSNAQTFFLQAALRYIFGQDIGRTGTDHDGVDGDFGSATEPVVASVLQHLNIAGDISDPDTWKAFLIECRKRAFSSGNGTAVA